MCMRWACFLVWVNSITWSVKVLVSRAGREKSESPLADRPGPSLWISHLSQGKDREANSQGWKRSSE
jgi:hypothetical protein